MNISEIKDLMSQFDGSSLREFSYKNGNDELAFSKNGAGLTPVVSNTSTEAAAPLAATAQVSPVVTESSVPEVEEVVNTEAPAQGNIVDSPLVGVAYLSPSPDKPAFVAVGDSVKKGQTLLIIEAMKVMNEVPAPQDGVITEILVSNEAVVEFGQGLVRIQ
ncbi:acetyl-CoA carboxylase biotin carboxyl carrier protein [Streptococcus sp. X16XC17]|uniref:acetyl-CoA carboxylase biotin carboxyl carrier protein n=1 Tax=unclassified Streptococcus TaxID=2608887 RepID=UPI00066FB4CD|nr:MULTISPECIES: acetyl-CoA carboxylase biotin carboxyl carrier protein [unclassified Streptococcus]TCD45679.1 acetyl-CoA carboxylase biotin carboxyl carrier protein [Streptococcus sp. X16XC17]